MVLRVELVVVTGPLAPVLLLASSGTAVADVLVDVGRVIKVIVLEEDDVELVDIEEEDGVEFNRLDDIAEELNCEEEDGGTLAMG